MRAVVRSFSSPDVDLSTYRSTTPNDDGFLLSMYVGPEEGPGEESFDLTVCTPVWLQRRVRESGPLIGRHYLFVEPLDVEVVTSFLVVQVRQLEAGTWTELAEKLARIAHWEFEDYRP